jgi:hypothetical protein
MIRISITAVAYKAIAKTIPLGSVAVEPQADAKGEREIWLEPRFVDRLRAMRGPGESYSDVMRDWPRRRPDAGPEAPGDGASPNRAA